MKLYVVLLLAAYVNAQGDFFNFGDFTPPEKRGLKEDSLLYSQYKPTTEQGFIEYSPADPNDHSTIGGSLGSKSVLIRTNEGKKSEFWGLTSSFEAGKVFFNDFRAPYLYEYDVNDEEIKVAYEELTNGLENLAYDRVTKMLYWTDSIGRAIMATENQYRHFTQILKTGTVTPSALVLHAVKRKLVFSVHKQADGFISNSQLLTCDLDGGNMKSLFRFPEVIRVLGLTIDYSEDTLYWTDIDRFQNTIVQAANFDGTGRKEFYSQSTGLLWGIAHYKEYFYVTNVLNVSSTQYEILIRNKDGTSGSRLLTPMKPRNVNIYGPNEVSKTKVRNECERSSCNHVCLASSAGRHTCKCSPGFKLIGSTCKTDLLDDNYLILADIGQKRVVQMELSEYASSVTEFHAYPLDDKTDEKIFSFTVDKSNGEIAWYNIDKKQIHWDDITFPFSFGVSSMEIDPCADILVWATSTTIYKLDKTGAKASSTPQSLYKLPFFTSSIIRQIVIDFSRQHIYWTEYNSVTELSQVWRMDYNGRRKSLVLDKVSILKPLKIDYETYTLYIMGMTNGILYSIPLKTLSVIPSTSPDYFLYKRINFGTYMTSKVYVIYSFDIVDGHVYMFDIVSKRMQRFNLKSGPSSLENYGPDGFHFVTNMAFYNERHYEKFIRPLTDCDEEITTPMVTTTRRSTTTTTRRTTPTTTTRTTTTTTTPPVTTPLNCVDPGPTAGFSELINYLTCLIRQLDTTG